MVQFQATALILSLAIEAPLALWLAQRTRKISGKGRLLLVIVAVCATLFTHPIVWAGNQILSGYLVFPVRAAIVETLAVLLEAVIYWQVLRFFWSCSLQISLITNLASFGCGLLLFSLK
jgi:hypothetical protein